ncbi:MAG: sugar phosphate isomerase/epimerase [Armatimonadetes bacterium]|nr:sugar phosphate isomerase/epimerase [Armatimonadota bacterium]
MQIVHNGTCTHYCNLLTDIKIAKETGYDGIEIIGSKLYRYLDQGHKLEDLPPLLEDLPAVAIGYVQDIERQEPSEYDALLRETEKMCSCAEKLGIPMVQLLTGPIGPGIGEEGGYRGLIGRPWPEVRDLTAKNLKVLADIAKGHNVTLYLEPLCWAPLCSLKQGLEVIDAVGKDNVLMLLDFYHLWNAGATPDDVANLDKSIIAGVQFCDSVPPKGRITHDLRHVWTGAGSIPLKEWADAVVSAGFDGWWTCELFSPVHWELDPWETAYNLRQMLIYTLAG